MLRLAFFFCSRGGSAVITQLPLLLLAVIGSSSSNPFSYTVSIDGREVGKFAKLERNVAESRPKPEDVEPVGTWKVQFELHDGWIEKSALDSWFEASTTDPEDLVFLQVSVGDRPRKSITVAPDSGGAARAMQRSWTLLEACPLEIKFDGIDESGRVWLRSIVLIGRDIAAAH